MVVLTVVVVDCNRRFVCCTVVCLIRRRSLSRNRSDRRCYLYQNNHASNGRNRDNRVRGIPHGRERK